MSRTLLTGIMLAAFLFVGAYADTLIDDPGNPDQVLIGQTAVDHGDTAIVPLRIICDENVEYVNIPIAYDNTSFSYIDWQPLGPFLLFEDLTAIDRPGESMVTIAGYAILYDPTHQYMNTNGQSVLVANLLFLPLPGIPENTYPLEITIDLRNGPLLFGDAASEQWTPLYENGFIQIVSEPGFADSVIVSSSTVLVGEPATVGISICSDEDVDQFTIPVSFDSVNFNLIGYQLYGDLIGWENLIIEQTPGTEIITIFGQATGDDPFLNTGGICQPAIDLYFTTRSGAPEGIYPFSLTVDQVYGPLTFKDINDNDIVPFSRNGHVTLTLPPSCDMEYNYLWAYGFCQSPSTNRQYVCRIRNNSPDAAENVVLTIAHPADFIYISSNPVAVAEGNVMTWDLGTVAAWGSALVNWWVDIPAGLGNDTVVTVADIQTSTFDIDSVDNHREFVEIIGYSYDPNDKIMDPSGYGTGHFITPNNGLMYTVYFENSDSATLPATDILILDTLDSKLDWSTIVIGPMSHPEPCSVWFNPESHVITCQCDNIMLPPNVDPPEGEGFFSFSVFPRWNVQTGNVISNRAHIRFDLNDWMAAPLNAPVFVTMDLTKPVSSVTPLPEQMINVSSFDVSWEGDDGQGSGIKYYDIYASVDGEPFYPWITETISTSASFQAESGHSYAFYSVATDNLGFREDPPTWPDAITTVLGGCTYLPGDVNGNNTFNGLDVTFSVSYFKGGQEPAYSCECPPYGSWHVSGDVNASCTFNGLDVTYSVSYFKGQGPGPVPCASCPPVGTLLSRPVRGIQR